MTPIQDPFYANHLGLRGVVMLLDLMRPKAAVIGEFGEELKDVRCELVRGIQRLLDERLGEGAQKAFVLPGDLTIAYDLERHAFLCHNTEEFHAPEEIEFDEVDESAESPFYCPGLRRTCVVAKAGKIANNPQLAMELFNTTAESLGQPYWRNRAPSGGAKGTG